MTRAHHLQPASSSGEYTNVTKGSRWSCDIYSGSAEALIAAGLITQEQLTPQQGRSPGYTAFLASGEPCPLHLRTWREPGFKSIREQDDGSYRVEVTVSKEVQAWRRKQERAVEHEAEQERINREVAESGHQYRNWSLRHDFGGPSETWEGTKKQLQAVGIGVGLQFPGEPGAPEEVNCKCPLGFDVRIYLPKYARAKAAAGIYTAHSRYVPLAETPKQYTRHAPGVLREVWTPSIWLGSDRYHGTADALIAAGLVPARSLFPGISGANKVQATYRKNWSPGTSSKAQWGATIRKQGNKGQYSVEVPVSKHEEQRREVLRAADNEATKQQERALAAERWQLRQSVERTEVSADEFRAKRAEFAEMFINTLWRQVFAVADGALTFDIPEEGELWEALGEAFQTIRDAVQQADILSNKKLHAALQTKLKLVAARKDVGLQVLLQEAKHLRLVRSAPDEE